MKTSDLFKKKAVLSFEIFPPKRTANIDTIYKALADMEKLKPDFISVTFGAGGSDNSKATIEIAKTIKEKYKIEPVAHLPCIGLTKNQVDNIFHSFKEAGIENILALRGDIPKDREISQGDFRYASDLISYGKTKGDFNFIGACYPEGHREAKSMVDDVKNLKLKVDAGASHLISQLFFDNEYFFRFRERCQLAGINVPIEAGIMPVVNTNQIRRMVELCHVDLPRKFVAMMEKYEDDKEAMLDAGIAYAINQIVGLLSEGVDGIHLYTMNNPEVATRIYNAVHRLLK